MELTIKHLAAYLPYNVAVFADDIKNTKPIHKLHLGQGIGALSHVLSSKRYKIVLRPLSDLTKEITINGEIFVPYDKLKGIVSESQWVKICDTINEDYNKICDMPYLYVNQLHKWHFDVFGLIENNLAINITEINNL